MSPLQKCFSPFLSKSIEKRASVPASRNVEISLQAALAPPDFAPQVPHKLWKRKPSTRGKSLSGLRKRRSGEVRDYQGWTRKAQVLHEVEPSS